MALTSEFYLARAAECGRDADESKLENVRDRNRRAEAAWLAMAGQSAAREAERDSLIAEKATRLTAAEKDASLDDATDDESEVTVHLEAAE